LQTNDPLSLSGTLGIKDGYQPIEYEEVKIKADGKVNIVQIYIKGSICFSYLWDSYSNKYGHLDYGKVIT